MKVQNNGHSKAKKRIFALDFDRTVLLGLEQLLTNNEMDFASETSPAKAIEAIAASEPDLVIIEILPYDGKDGIVTLRELRRRFPYTPVLVLTRRDERLFARYAIEAGALGYVSKTVAPEEITAAVQSVLRGDPAFSRAMAAGFMNDIVKRPQGKKGALSPREREVFGLLGEGVGTKEVALRLEVNIKTVESYRAHIKEKLSLRSGRELVQRAMAERAVQ